MVLDGGSDFCHHNWGHSLGEGLVEHHLGGVALDLGGADDELHPVVIFPDAVGQSHEVYTLRIVVSAVGRRLPREEPEGELVFVDRQDLMCQT